MTLMGDEPEIGLGDSGEHVQQLQDRLRGLQLLQDQPDGAFGDSTEQAVRQMQQTLGLDADGRVTQQTWEALDHHMLQYGLQYNAYAGAGNQQWDQPDWGQDPAGGQDAAGAGGEHDNQYAEVQVGSISPDGHWQWDGQEWQPHTGQQAGGQDEPPVIPHIDNIHPNIAGDERFSTFHDFLREQHAQ